MKEYENELYKTGIKYIGGVDEVGRGPLVGPVVTACVILPKDYYDERINDSKKISEKKREELYDVIMNNALSVGIGVSSEKVIDKINILEATKKAMKEAINNCNIKPEHVLIDAVKLDIDIPSTSIIKGDAKSQSIAAASIIAKVTRDRMMYELDKKHPEYGFAKNKGYGTKQHIEALYKYGPLKEHRKTFEPVTSIINKNS
jgi:ribonuclease HII